MRPLKRAAQAAHFISSTSTKGFHLKHAFLCALAIASCLLAPSTHAQLQWLGPLPPAAKPAATPKPPATAPSTTTPATRSAKRRIDDDPEDTSPRKSRHKAQLPLELVIKDNQAKVCQLTNTLTTVCAVIEAPLPPGTTVKLWNLPDRTTALTYMRTPGVQGAPDAKGKAAVRFQAAFNGAARAVLAYTRSAARAPGLHGSEIKMVCDNEDCVEVDDDETGGGGNGGNAGGNGGGGGGGGGETGGNNV
jgi:hypothetical protein